MTGPADRRGFLRGLVSLPLIGGGVTLIGAPSAVAEPVTRPLLMAYSEWLRVERNALHVELFGATGKPEYVEVSALPMRLETWNPFYVPPLPAWQDARPASSRAALVLGAVGCDWRGGGR